MFLHPRFPAEGSKGTRRAGRGPTTRPTRQCCRGRRAWTVEALEDRTLLSTFTVNSLADTSATGTLRWAIAQADQTAGAKTINFAVTGSDHAPLGPAGPEQYHRPDRHRGPRGDEPDRGPQQRRGDDPIPHLHSRCQRSSQTRRSHDHGRLDHRQRRWCQQSRHADAHELHPGQQLGQQLGRWALHQQLLDLPRHRLHLLRRPVGRQGRRTRELRNDDGFPDHLLRRRRSGLRWRHQQRRLGRRQRKQLRPRLRLRRWRRLLGRRPGDHHQLHLLQRLGHQRRRRDQ